MIDKVCFDWDKVDWACIYCDDSYMCDINYDEDRWLNCEKKVAIYIDKKSIIDEINDAKR